MTHKELVKRAGNWLRNNQSCSVVILERATRISETPDAIGFKATLSILIECKTNRADFLADKKKWFRKYEQSGVGDLRYFLAPPGVIRSDDGLEGWGYLECLPHRINVIIPANVKVANKANEVAILVSSLRRLEIAATVFVRHETEETTLEAE